MIQKVAMLQLLAGVALAGFVAIGAAQAQSSGQTPVPSPAPSQASSVPLPSSGPSANPAQPNCYPDVNHCASYPTGDSIKDNSYQYNSPQMQSPAPQPGK
jgi:hypothetical protein